MTENEVIQLNCKRFREESGMTQQQLADESGISIDAIRAYEGKRRTPDRPRLKLLADTLGRKMDDFTLENPPPPNPESRPPIALKVGPHAPADIRKRAEEYAKQLNREYFDRVHAIKKKEPPKRK
jgi:transcriptional regulator with XRE-family HTH domain